MCRVLTTILVLGLTLGTLGDNGTPGSNVTCNTGTPGDTTADQLKLQQAINKFSFEFFKKVAASNPGENLIVSAFSVALPFYQLMLFSKDETLSQLQTTLNVASIDQLRRAIIPVLDAIKGGKGVVLNKVNTIYFNDKYSLQKSAGSDVTCLFNATIEPIDCSQPEASANKINKMVADNTDNKITKLIPADIINDLVRMILVNAIYFKGTWKMQFNKNLTEQSDFYTCDNKTTQVSMMYMKARLNYTHSSDLKAKVVVLDYINPKQKFILVLPDEKCGLADVTNKMNAAVMDKILSSIHETQIKLWMPTFKINFGLGLNDILISMGMKDIFDSSQAKLFGLLENDPPLSVSDVIHKAVMEVNEEGTVAAAATAVIVTAFSSISPPPQIPEIKCDHPYMYAIYDGSVPVFIGRVIVGTTSVSPSIPEVKCDHPFLMMLRDGSVTIFTGAYQKKQKD